MYYVELMVRWTEFQMKKPDAQEEYIKQLVEGEGTPPQMNVNFSYSPMVLNLTDVARFNKANDDQHTTLRFIDGESYVVKINYENFKDLWTDCIGRTIVKVKEGDEPIADSKNIDDLDI